MRGGEEERGEGKRKEGRGRGEREGKRREGRERGERREGGQRSERKKLVKRHWVGQCPERPSPSIAIVVSADQSVVVQ